ncbi:FeoA [Rhodovulum sp. PH10]|nr:FeoA [Rhodovulum sp. PH10]
MVSMSVLSLSGATHGLLSSVSLPAGPQTPLGKARRGFCGHVDAISADGYPDLPAGELESRLIELGFVEGARIEILHEGAFGRDPIAVRVNEATIALRRREAMAILVS